MFRNVDAPNHPDIESPNIGNPEPSVTGQPSIELPLNITSPVGYVLSDFGENAINNHYTFHEAHSEKVQNIFNYVTRYFRERCTCYESYKTIEAGNSIVDKSNVLSVSSELDSDIIMIPYVGGSQWFEYEYYDFVLPVGSHYSNDGSDGDKTNSNRKDITSSAETLLTNSVAVSARPDIYSEFEKHTSFGYGMEFFEDISGAGLDEDYPDKDIPTALAELLSDDGITFYSNVHLSFTQYINVGEVITIRRGIDNYETCTVATINSPNSFTATSQITPITVGGIYGWHDVRLSSYCGGQAQSWAVPLVAGKLKVIKMATMKDWDTVRYAARKTARRKPTGNPTIDNTYWDIYRGFGQIQVQDAIQFINDNY